jgi:hypothetical protein
MKAREVLKGRGKGMADIKQERLMKKDENNDSIGKCSLLSFM